MTKPEAMHLARQRADRHQETQYVIYDPTVDDLPCRLCYFVCSLAEIDTFFFDDDVIAAVEPREEVPNGSS